MSTSSTRVWLITGCSSGFGQEIAKASTLAYGELVVATARDPAKLKELESHGATTFVLDVLADDDELKDISAAIVKEAGQIDILVHNAGYILTGAVEECSRHEVLDQFQTNVFEQLNVIRAVLPHMRAQTLRHHRQPRKAAVTVFTESLRQEVRSLGIDVTAIEPGYFRTHFLSSGHKTRAANLIEDY
ncbi:MAG: hypothetical protein Q9184_005396 [Pyrenodesmia sp. 2 TL-2023]